MATERGVDPMPVALAGRPGTVPDDPVSFWLAVIDGRFPTESGTSLGVPFALVVDLLADPENIAILEAALARNERAETTGPILDPSAWRGNRWDRARLVRRVVQSARDLGRAEQARRAGWGGDRG